MRTDMKAKVFECRMDRFELPVAVLGNGVAIVITRALRSAEMAGEALGTALLRLHPGTERENPSWPEVRAAMAEVVRLAQRTFWTTSSPSFACASTMGDWRAMRKAGRLACRGAGWQRQQLSRRWRMHWPQVTTQLTDCVVRRPRATLSTRS